jgi:hypothetical protein
MDLQKLVDAMNEASSRERSNYHLTLGGLIDALAAADQGALVRYDFSEANPSAPESYRGYYSDLSFPPSSSPITVGEILKEAKDAIGSTFEGYKGGDFTMSTETTLWASPYGSASGRAIMGFATIGADFLLITKVID